MTINIVRTGDDYDPQQISTWRLRELLAKEKAYEAIRATYPPQGPCWIQPLLDRVCARGTYGCTVRHGQEADPPPVPREGEGMTDRDRLRALIADMLAKERLIRADSYGNVRAIATLVGSWADVLAAVDASLPDRAAVTDLRAYGEAESTTALHAKDRDQYQFWQGWNAALDRLPRLEVLRDPPVLAADPPQLNLWMSVNQALHAVNAPWRIERHASGQAVAVPTPEVYSDLAADPPPVQETP